MNYYTGFQYLLIDLANQFGLDKKLFEERIQWGMDNLGQLETLVEQAETKPLYIKAMMAIRKAQAGLPSGHLVALDGVCSGIQIMSAITGCEAGANATGLIDPNRRANAYKDTGDEMREILGDEFEIDNADAKSALMKSFYGSRAVPKQLFGEDTEELAAFYKAAHTIAPGAWELLQDLLAAWQPGALAHSWKLPDGFDVVVKVMTKKEAKIEVDELDHATFTYEFFENEGQKKGLSLVANVTHSLDAYVLRCMHRRCNYDRAMVENANALIAQELDLRVLFDTIGSQANAKVGYYVEQYERSGMADVVILPYLNVLTIGLVPSGLLEKLYIITGDMLSHKPFELVTIHDSFASHPNNCNQVRYWYKEILAELAESTVISDILNQIHGSQGTFPKLSNDLADKIRNSAYALS